MPAGASVSLSPLLASLAISRLFGKDFATLPSRYELMVILTPSGSLNYEATAKFVDQLNSHVRDRIVLAVCLDALTHD